MTRILRRIAAFMQTTAGFGMTQLLWLVPLVGGIFFWSATYLLVFTLFLSVFAIVMSSTILVAGARDIETMKVQLAELILAIPTARDELAHLDDEE